MSTHLVQAGLDAAIAVLRAPLHALRGDVEVGFMFILIGAYQPCA